MSVVGDFVILLAILFLFINKKLCFEKRGGLSCLEQGRRKHYKEKSRVHEGLGKYHNIIPPLMYRIFSRL